MRSEVLRLIASAPFAGSPQQLLTLALVARNGGCRPSQILNVSDELAALDFDTACTYRLLRFENERESDRFKALAAMLGGAGDEETNIAEDENTEVW